MKSVTMVEFRNNAESIIRQIQSGQNMLLMYRGKPVIQLEPLRARSAPEDDPFYRLYELAEEKGEALSNQQIDEILYGD